MRVLEWMIERVEGTAQGHEHPFGISPRYEDLNWQGMSFSAAQFASVMESSPAEWKTELGLHAELFKQLENHLPKELPATKARIEDRLAA